MLNLKTPPQLTKEEQIEFNELSNKVFKENSLQLNSNYFNNTDKPEVKRLDFLLSKHLTYLAFTLEIKRQAMWN